MAMGEAGVCIQHQVRNIEKHRTKLFGSMKHWLSDDMRCYTTNLIFFAVSITSCSFSYTIRNDDAIISGIWILANSSPRGMGARLEFEEKNVTIEFYSDNTFKGSNYHKYETKYQIRSGYIFFDDMPEHSIFKDLKLVVSDKHMKIVSENQIYKHFQMYRIFNNEMLLDYEKKFGKKLYRVPINSKAIIRKKENGEM